MKTISDKTHPLAKMETAFPSLLQKWIELNETLAV